jgi:histidyl-tRNA synthetase
MSAPSVQAPRGTRDLLPADQPVWQLAIRTAHTAASRLGFAPITVPTYEETGLFHRSIGAGTDILDKELFVVKGVKAEEETAPYALRPELTASIVRAYIQHGMHTWPQPVKLYSIASNFRYERPQKGRYREHTQFDVEYFGDKGAFADAWVIFCNWEFFHLLGLTGITLKLNTLGTPDERQRFKEALVGHFTPLRHRLSPDSQTRLDINPLRILDSKDPADRELCGQAPNFAHYLGEGSQVHFQAVQSFLTEWGIPFTLDPYLVRGLDYYSHTTFEWTVAGKTGQQDSLGGGGRYDGLLPYLGGPDA